MQIIIFSSPDRKSMLKRLLKELNGHDIFVIDSPETFGKKRFWQRWKIAREYCLKSKHDNYLVIPDDILQLNFDQIHAVFSYNFNRKFFCNIINDGRVECWGAHRSVALDFNIDAFSYFAFGYFDCGGLTNRKTLELIDIEQVPTRWFNSENKSSGVGHQITTKARCLNIPMLTPYPSLAFHGNHVSIMNPLERKKQPLISI
jgi:hypothetical protein